VPTLYAAQLSEPETPWPEIWNRMYQGLVPNARQILALLGYYVEHDLHVPPPDAPLTADEIAELTPIVSALTIAAVECARMPDGVLLATLKTVAKSLSRSASSLPAAVLWEMAANYRRGQEKPGTFAMDIWGSDQTRSNYVGGEPMPDDIARAAEAAASRIQAQRSRGRRHHRAYPILAESLGAIFRASGQAIQRHRKKLPRSAKDDTIYTETGPFHEFLALVLSPLRDVLRERGLPPITVDSIVRMAADPASTVV
jgi:hypothetical protein